MLTKIFLSLLVLLLSTASTIPQTKVFNSTRDQAESPIAINPTNSNNLIGTAITIEDLFAKIGYYYSLDGGINWIGNEE